MRNFMARPELSIVIPTYNRPDLLAACLRSVLRYGPPDAEILVVDDGSPGARGVAIARTFGVDGLRLPRRKGFCAAANAGIRATRGSVIELLNDDTVVTSNWARYALAAFSDTSVAAVAPLVLMAPSQTPEDRIDSAGDRYFLWGVAAKRGHGQAVQPAHLKTCRVFGASASCAFYRREALEAVGLFPEEFGAYFEDVDLAFRLHRAGFLVLFEPASRVYHRRSASYGKPDRRLLKQQSFNEERVFWRNLPVPVLLRAIPGHVAVLAAKMWRRCREGNLAPFVSGRLQVLSELPELLRYRRRLQRRYPAHHVSGWQLEERYGSGQTH
jgi:GT2 family glycosyltransferase